MNATGEGTPTGEDEESIQGNCNFSFDLDKLYYSGWGREPSALMAGASASSSDDDEEEEPPAERVSYPWHAVVDSGASAHMMQIPPKHFSEWNARNCRIEIAKQGAHLNSVGEGTLPIRVQGQGNTRVNLDLENTLFTPDINKNLFSVIAACEMGLSAIFTKDHVLFCREGDYSEILFTGRREGSLWIVNFDLKHNAPVEHALAAGCQDELVVRLHEQYAHATLRRLKEMAIDGELDDVPKPTRRALGKAVEISCTACAAGKQRIKKMTKNRPRLINKYEPFELMVCDHAGPYPRQRGGYRYMSVWVCARTGFTFTFKMSNLTASANIENAEIVMAYVKTQTPHRWRKLRSDRGPDWTARMLGKWMGKNGFVQQLAPPDAQLPPPMFSLCFHIIHHYLSIFNVC